MLDIVRSTGQFLEMESSTSQRIHRPGSQTYGGLLFLRVLEIFLPPKTTEWTAPSRVIAKIAIMVSGINGM